MSEKNNKHQNIIGIRFITSFGKTDRCIIIEEGWADWQLYSPFGSQKFWKTFFYRTKWCFPRILLDTTALKYIIFPISNYSNGNTKSPKTEVFYPNAPNDFVWNSFNWNFNWKLLGFTTWTGPYLRFEGRDHFFSRSP